MSRTKTELRALLKQRRLSMPAIVASHAAARATQRLLERPEVRSAKTIAAYIPIRGEIDAWPAIRALLGRGQTLLLPRINAGLGTLFFHNYDGHTPLVVGPKGIPEPGLEFPTVEPAAIDVFIVPGLGFDLTGNRLGWGHGYYDRVLRESSGTRLGFAYDCQILEEIPRQPNDIPMHCLVTEQRAVNCSPPSV